MIVSATVVHSIHLPSSFPAITRCGECDRIFKSSRSLEVHGHSHMRQSDFPCELCPKLFPTLYRMQKHMKTHLGLRKCLICPERCPGIDALQQHIMDAHNLGENWIHFGSVLPMYLAVLQPFALSIDRWFGRAG